MKHRAEGIDETVAKTRRWLGEIADGLETNSERSAFLVLRCVLHAIRDHLPIDEAAQLSAQLPMLVRGAYFEGWDPSKTPVRERTAEQFLHRVQANAVTGEPLDARRAIRVVGEVMGRHVSEGELRQVLDSLPHGVRELFAAAD